MSLTYEHLELSARIQSVKAAEGFHVKGFASIEGVDRHGEEIPARAFDIETFKRNPQLWFEHDLFRRASDDLEVPVGVVEEMHIVKIVEGAGGILQAIDETNGQIVEQFADAEEFLIKVGDRGLWVVAKILEPEIIELISDNRINAFSWAGTLQRRVNGTISKIDIREVSLVFLPANARALFMIGKDAFNNKDERYLFKSGTAFPIKSDAVLEPIETGTSYQFLVQGAQGACSTIPRDFETLDEAKAFAEQLAQAAHTVGVFKNTWKGIDDLAAYEIVHLIEGKAVDLPPDIMERANGLDWSAAYVDDLPDSAFAFIEPGNSKDSDEKTTPRTSRKFPYRDASGALSKMALRYSIIQAKASPYAAVALQILIKAAHDVGLRDWLLDKQSALLTKNEQRLFGISGEIALDPATAAKGWKGGEIDTMDETLQKQFDEMLGLMKSTDEKMAAVTARLDAYDEKAAALEKSESNPASTSADATSGAVAKEDGDPALDKTDVIVNSIKQVIDVMGNMNEKMDTLSTRVLALEDTPIASQRATENGDTPPVTPVVESDTIEDLRKSMAKLSPEDRKALNGAAINDLFMGGLAPVNQAV